MYRNAIRFRNGVMFDENTSGQVDRFIVDQIDSVPHLEALLILWNGRPKQQSAEEIARLLYVPREVAVKILADLEQRRLISAADAQSTTTYYGPNPEIDSLLQKVDEVYRRELIRISRLIHSKGPAAVRDFARAFRFTKDRE